jgi:hypothetical protein
MNRPVQLRTPLSHLGGNADAYLAHYLKKVVEAVGYGAAMRIDPSSGAEPVVEVEFWVPDDENGVEVTKEAMLRAAGAGFITEVIVIPAPLFSTA